MRECLSKALAAWAEEDWATAMREYLKNLRMASEQERMDRYQEQFSQLLVASSKAGFVFNDKNKLLQDVIFPKSPLVLWTLANELMEKDPFHSMTLYAKAASLSGGLDLVNAFGSLLTCRATIVSTWHIKMVNDAERNMAYAAALSRIVQPDSRVIDIGAGTGLLTMLASRYTRHPVIGLEGERPMAQLAERCVEKNGLHERIDIEPVMSAHYTPPETHIPSVIVSETMDAGGLGEKLLQIFHDAHLRYRGGGDPAHPIVFCPSKLSFFVVVIQSDKFWRTRYHAHNCQEYGCDDECMLRRWNCTLFSEHDTTRSHDTTYTTMDPADYDDIVFLSQPTFICATQLDNMQYLIDMDVARVITGTFKVNVERAGRADAVLLYWKAQLSPEVELQSVREGGWEYAAYPLQARTQYQPGDTFHGEWVVNFEQGININHIPDPATMPGRDALMRGPYDKYLLKKDDGTIELVNNPSLRRFLPPIRLASWLILGQDDFFPVTADGTLQYQYLSNIKERRKRGERVWFDNITSLKAYGCLFRADHIDSCARVNPSAQLGVDLSPLAEFSLQEYREIRGAFRGDGRFQKLSPPVLLIDVDPRRDYDKIVTGNQCEAMPISTSPADGVLYWWSINDEWSNLEAELPLAACLFGKRETVMQGVKFCFNVFMKDSELLLSYGTGRISVPAAAAAPEAPPPSPAGEEPMQQDPGHDHDQLAPLHVLRATEGQTTVPWPKETSD